MRSRRHPFPLVLRLSKDHGRHPFPLVLRLSKDERSHHTPSPTRYDN
jgi:hypothetical protein